MTQGDEVSARISDGHCGGGAPRWNLVVQDPPEVVVPPDDGSHTVFLGCASADHSEPTGDDDWIKDAYDADAIQDALAAAGVDPGATITQLYALFDEGIDTPPNAGSVYLDNITVELNDTAKVFTSPGDNGR